MSVKVYIDGNSGTTGLKINKRLSERRDIELLYLPDDKRKDPDAKKDIYSESDIVFFCLPDAAARESAQLAREVMKYHPLRIIDTSTAHRTEDGWAYGFPELSAEYRRNIESSPKIAVPGCHASGFIALVKPLIDSGVLSKDINLCCHSLTGYSGGGKNMIAEYEEEIRDIVYDSPRQYGLTQQHKHLKEMVKISGLSSAPAFCPIVGDFYSGMLLSVPVFRRDLKCGIDGIREIYKEKYNSEIVCFSDSFADEKGFIGASALSGTDIMKISVYGNDERMVLIALYDNLGKGASGAAIQCFNIMTGIDETTGLVIK